MEELTGKDRGFPRGWTCWTPTPSISVFAEGGFDAVIHFAGLKAVGESVEKPLWYYKNNVVGTLNLLDSMEKAGVRRLVFSSSATVYGASEEVPLIEKSPLDATNPYGRTKEQIEDILSDLSAADPRWSIALLRYFNPVGAHESGRIGEDPQRHPEQPAAVRGPSGRGPPGKGHGLRQRLPTADGTGVRDYIHVMDLAAGHLAALALPGETRRRVTAGTSAPATARPCWKSSMPSVPLLAGRFLTRLAPRRPGDAAVSYADASAALAELGWAARRNLCQMCEDHWRWQSSNPMGYTGRLSAGRRVHAPDLAGHGLQRYPQPAAFDLAACCTLPRLYPS